MISAFSDEKFRPETLKDNEIWVNLCDINVREHVRSISEENFAKGVCDKMDWYAHIVVSDMWMPFAGDHTIRSTNLRVLRISFCPGSDVTLRIDCPNLIALNIENCSRLIMSSATQPRRLELVNVGAQGSVVNIPTVDSEREWHLIGKCDNEDKVFWGQMIITTKEINMKIRERFLWI